MAISKLFVFSIIFSIVLLPFMLFIIALDNQYHRQILSLRIELDQLKSRVTVLESHIERSKHKLHSEEDDIAEMEKILLEREENIADLKNRIDTIPQKGSLDTNKDEINAQHSPVIGLDNQSFILAQWNDCWKPFFDGSFHKIRFKMSQALRDADICIEMVKTEYIPVLKNLMLTFMSNLKPHFEFLTSETIEAYHGSKKFLISNAVKFQRSATPFMQDLYKHAKPIMNQILTMANIYLDTALVSLGNLVKKISVFLYDLWKG